MPTATDRDRPHNVAFKPEALEISVTKLGVKLIKPRARPRARRPRLARPIVHPAALLRIALSTSARLHVHDFSTAGPRHLISSCVTLFNGTFTVPVRDRSTLVYSMLMTRVTRALRRTVYTNLAAAADGPPGAQRRERLGRALCSENRIKFRKQTDALPRVIPLTELSCGCERGREGSQGAHGN
ncbi:hypothetical protein EVAR_10066_1 [Eumeta japonica]|uniref:Uncharacterized protein n=1 Tax=Eumeta variegata TaxID=151549 RepID=A0A4C1TRF6_EUMVA|nr:hypothetical protein EVAR_10066_1 [Eumeta japonica]